MARIVFDLDGTLIDSAPDIRAVANAVLADMDRPPITPAETRDFIGDGTDVFVQRLRAARDIGAEEHARMLADFMHLYADAVTLTRPYPGVIAALSDLRAAGHALGICTNKPMGPTRRVLDHLDLTRFFATVLGGDSLPLRKPDPSPLHAAFAALPEGPRIYVGDSDVDAETGARAQVPFVLFTEGYRKSPVAALPHAAHFAHFDDLGEIVARLLA